MNVFREILWFVSIVVAGFLLLPIMHLIDWSDLYLHSWYFLKNKIGFSSGWLIRICIIGVVSFCSAFILLLVWRLGLRLSLNNIRLFQVVLSLFVFASLEVGLVWAGYFPGSVFRNFRTVQKLINMPTHYTSTDSVSRYLQNEFQPPDFVINQQGFRSTYSYDSLTVKKLKEKGKKLVMVIGDSYVAGHNASPITSCFADLLESDSVAVFNFGVSATNTFQYRLIAQKYIPELRPDIVIVCIYKNDFYTYENKTVPGIPIAYRTNASPNGNMIYSQKPLFFGFKPGEFFTTYSQAYEFYRKHYSLRFSSKWWERWISCSSLNTLIYVRLFPFQAAQVGTAELGAFENLEVQKQLYNNLNPILGVCIKYFASCYLLGIPAAEEKIVESKRFVKQGENVITVICPQGFLPEDYVSSQADGHFNNKGHYKYYRFIQKVTGLGNNRNEFKTTDYRQ